MYLEDEMKSSLRDCWAHHTGVFTSLWMTIKTKTCDEAVMPSLFSLKCYSAVIFTRSVKSPLQITANAFKQWGDCSTKRKKKLITWNQVGGVNIDFEAVSGCVGLHTSTLKCEKIKENGNHHATIWAINIIMKKSRVSVEVCRASQHERNAYGAQEEGFTWQVCKLVSPWSQSPFLANIKKKKRSQLDSMLSTKIPALNVGEQSWQKNFSFSRGPIRRW